MLILFETIVKQINNMDEAKIVDLLKKVLQEEVIPKITNLDNKVNGMISKIDTISSDLAEIRHDLGYNNLRIIKGKKDLEEM